MMRKGTNMKKKNVFMYFLRSLMKSLLVIAAVLLVGFTSYKVSYHFLSANLSDDNVTEKEIEKILDEAKTDDISKNLIYVCDDKQRISHMMLEICNTKTNNMDYITIPVKTDYTIPTKMYQKLCSVDEEIPQIVRLAKLRSYFPDFEDEKAFGYAELIIEKMLGVDISYFTVITDEIYASHYTEVEAATSYNVVTSTSSSEDATDSTDKSAQMTGAVIMKVATASDAYKSQLKDLGSDETKIVDFIKDQYERVTSNLTVYNKIGYLECYEKMNTDYFHYWGIPGEFKGTIFAVDENSTKSFIKGLEENTTSYTEAQTLSAKAQSKKIVSSKGLNILVLNGSKITGLATTTQNTLVEAGYTVPKVGDYTDETLTQTKIIVSKKNQGQDLAAYFKNPEITVGTVSDGYDIEIILGTVDAN